MSEGPSWVFAAYQGYCADCAGDIDEGDPITYDEDIDGWICESCGDR